MPPTAARQVTALLALVARAGGQPLTRRDGLWASPFRPAGRKHTKPWAVAADVAQLCLVVLADDGEAGRFPLTGSTLDDAATVLAETVSAHVGVELEPHDLTRDLLPCLFSASDPAGLQALAATLDEATVAALAGP